MPYRAFVDALGALVAGCPADELRDFVGADGDRPDAACSRGRRTARWAAPTTTSTRPRRAATACSRPSACALTRVSLAVPLLLVLDDLQWVAKPTLLLLRHVVQVASPGLLAIGIFRDTDLDRTHPWRACSPTCGRTATSSGSSWAVSANPK